MPARTKTKSSRRKAAKSRRWAIDADVVAQIDRLVKSGRYPSRLAVVEAAFAALQRADDGLRHPPRRTREQLEREARIISKRKQPRVNFTAAMRDLK
jgi:Arc/MetJ-type ribon-helix-helix transcriptional regulator